MESKTFTVEDAIASGFHISRGDLLAATGWSETTFVKRLKAMTCGLHYVYCQGKTRRTTCFSDEALKYAGIAVGEPVDDYPDHINPEEVNDPDSLTGTDVMALQHNGHGVPDTHAETDVTALQQNGNGSTAMVRHQPVERPLRQLSPEAYITLVLNKKFLTIDEAVAVSGLTQKEMLEISELRKNRRVVRRSKIDEL